MKEKSTRAELVKLIADQNFPFQMVESGSFIEFVKTINARAYTEIQCRHLLKVELYFLISLKKFGN